MARRWRTVVAGLVVASLAAAGGSAAASEDSAELVEFSLSTTQVDVSGGDAEVTVRLRVRDPEGFDSTPWVMFTSADGSGASTGPYDSLELVAGDAFDGTWQGQARFGLCGAAGRMLADVRLGARMIDADELAARGFAHAVEVSGTFQGNAAPQLVGLTVSPATVAVDDAAVTVDVAAHVTDDECHTNHVSVYFTSPSGGQRVWVEGWPPDADRRDAVWHGSEDLPRWSEAGSWIVSVYVDDVSGAGRFYDAAELETLGIPSRLEVQSSFGADEQAPVLTDLQITPLRSEVSGGPQTVTVTASARDDHVGHIQATAFLCSREYCFRDVYLDASDGGTATTLTGTVEVPQSDTGVWTVSIELGDGRWNSDWWDPARLRDSGMPDRFTVTSQAYAYDAPTPPQQLAATTAPGEVRLTWAASIDDGSGWDDLSAIDVYRDGEVIAVLPGSATAFRDTGLTPGSRHAYALAAVNRYAEGALTDAVEVRIPAPPAPPVDVVVTSGEQPGEAAVSWSPPTDDGGRSILGYVVRRDDAVIAELDATARSWRDAGLQPGSTHVYAVSAVNEIGEGLPAVRAVTLASVPSAPPDLRAAPGDMVGEIHLTWSPPSSDGGSPLTAYRIFRDGILIADVAPDDLAYDDTGRAPATATTYTVQAVNAVGASTPSPTACSRPFPWITALPVPCP